MIHITYSVKASERHGVGIFANQTIKAGDLIYIPTPMLDIDLSQSEFRSLNQIEQREIKYYGYFNKKTSKWYVAFDAIRFLNHASKSVANVTQDENMMMTAKRDIQYGEELLQD